MKFHISKILLTICVLFLFIIPKLQAQPQPDFKVVQTNIADRLAEGDVLGIGIAYIHPDGRTRFISRGSLTPKRDQTITKNTIFEIGSITKTFTALLMAKMIEEGAFKLDTPIETLLPDSVRIPSFEGKKITLRHLATHTAGLPSVPANMFPAPDRLNPYADYSVEQMYDFVNSYELTEAPGSSFAYSNLELGLLGHIMERKSGLSYEQLVKKYIANPLGMPDTGIKISDQKQSRFADPYNYGALAKHWNFLTLAGAGAIRSTAEDLAKYMKAQIGLIESPLESAIKKTHQIRFNIDSDNGVDIGLGWFYSTKEDTIIWHNGGTGGFQSFAGFNKEAGTAVVVLSNGKDKVDDIGLHLLDVDHALKEVQKSVAIDTTLLDSYTGTYAHFSGIKYYVNREEDRLFVKISGQSVHRIFPKSSNRFFYKVVDAEIEFRKDSTGVVTGLRLFQNGQEITAKKISDKIEDQ